MEADTIDNIMNDANDIALSWYSVLSGKPLPQGPQPIIPQYAVNQAAVSAAQTAPLTTLVVSQVTQPWVIAGIAVIVIGLVFLSQK